MENTDPSRVVRYCVVPHNFIATYNQLITQSGSSGRFYRAGDDTMTMTLISPISRSSINSLIRWHTPHHNDQSLHPIIALLFLTLE